MKFIKCFHENLHITIKKNNKTVFLNFRKEMLIKFKDLVNEIYDADFLDKTHYNESLCLTFKIFLIKTISEEFSKELITSYFNSNNVNISKSKFF